ncbi:ribonuclease P 40kDa subunit-domain-containing protein [Mycena latifolia]|nr:ribonuclease P 40kDa subunit-domain-containing protein [Mycena latifolia]
MSSPRQHVQICTGALPDGKLQTLAAAHPFTQQERRRPQRLDVLFPAHPALHAALLPLHTAYVSAHMELAAATSTGTPLTMLSADGAQDDAWCIDARGVLTLHLAAPSYETLGIVGAKLPFKGYGDEHTVTVPLRPSDADARKLRAWDVRRAQAGLEPWPVLYCAADADATARAAAANGHTAQLRSVAPEARTSADIRMPTVTLPPRPARADADAVADWEGEMRVLFEWVGMAGLGAQRLQAHDRADAYVAVYDAPAPATIAPVAHLRWRGFLSPAFVQSVVDAVFLHIRYGYHASDDAADVPQFVALTAHAFPAAPVSYVPPGKSSLKSPARVPRADGEDAWCVIVARGGGDSEARWCVAESIGPLDARWG